MLLRLLIIGEKGKELLVITGAHTTETTFEQNKLIKTSIKSDDNKWWKLDVMNKQA